MTSNDNLRKSSLRLHCGGQLLLSYHGLVDYNRNFKILSKNYHPFFVLGFHIFLLGVGTYNSLMKPKSILLI